MKLAEIVSAIEFLAPPALQEDYDNAGLITGHREMEIQAVLVCLDVTEAVLEEAATLGANLIVSHHPIVFHPMKRFTGITPAERILIRAIREGLAIYSAHTNLDNVPEGVNAALCEKLGLKECRILSPRENDLRKLVVFVPLTHVDPVRTALFEAGAGHIGQYDACSFNVEGQGSFRALPGTHPYAGEIGTFHLEKEVRVETVFPTYLQNKVIQALLNTHPYEEVAYDIYRIENVNPKAGAGMVGTLPIPAGEVEFLQMVKKTLSCGVIRHSPLLNKPVSRVAVCGGSGSFLMGKALSAGADVFLTADIKYHQFFETDGKILLADIGHYESEQYTIDIFYTVLTKNFPNFAIHFSRINTNCINYL